MLKIARSSKHYNRILFSSDFHYGHNKEFLWGGRGFNSAEEHNKWLEDQIDTLTPNDLLINLGDVGLTIGATGIIDFLNTIPCETLMVFGNHNSGVWQLYKDNLPEGFDKQEIYPIQINPNITMMGYQFLLDIDHSRFYCSHMAPLIWEGMNQSNPVCALIGHSHSTLKQANPEGQGFGKLLDVGVENAIKYNGTAFFSIQEVRDIVNNKTISTYDQH